MPCYHPLDGYRSRYVNPNTGKRSIVFNLREGLSDLRVTIPCGRCIGCRLEHSRQNALRCVHEASLYENNCFLTLTYNSKFLPDRGYLDYDAPVLFMKRLRKRFGSGIRSFGCAEYGSKGKRPHYHLLVFNFDFEDKKLWKEDKGFKLYRSEALEELWPFGYSSVGPVTFETAAYVARYVTKKQTGPLGKLSYQEIDYETGEVFERPAERAVCRSLKPGIGRPWLDKYMFDVYPKDFVTMRGRKMHPPKYYDKIFDIEYPSEFATISGIRHKTVRGLSDLVKSDRRRTREALSVSEPDARLDVKEKVAQLNFDKLKRGYEDDFEGV